MYQSNVNCQKDFELRDCSLIVQKLKILDEREKDKTYYNKECECFNEI